MVEMAKTAPISRAVFFINWSIAFPRAHALVHVPRNLQ